MTAPQSLRCRLAGRAGPQTQLLARHKQSTGLFVSGLGPQGAPSGLGLRPDTDSPCGLSVACRRPSASGRWRPGAGHAARRSFILGLVVLAGCGFELRRAPELHFKTLQLAGFKAHSPLADELRRQIGASTTTRVVEAATQAEVVLEALADSRDKGVVASTTAGQVREVQLRSRLQFRLRTPAGKELITPTELVLTRDMSYNERDALAKEQEEEALYRAMQGDIAAQVMRRLAAVQSL